LLVGGVGSSGLLDQTPEAVKIDAMTVNLQTVSTQDVLQPKRYIVVEAGLPQHLPQPSNVAVQPAPRRSGRILAPNPIDQRLRRDRLARVDQQRR
jgi:hypothetical protein